MEEDAKILNARPYLQSVSLLREKIPDFGAYPFSLPIIQTLKTVSFHSDMTFFIGDNGSGKSTLIEAIAILLKFNPEGGGKNFNFATAESHSPLHQYLKAYKSYKMPADGYFLRAESFYNVASNIDKLDEEPFGGPPIKNSYGGQSLHVMSHGESFWALLNKRLSGDGIYLMDEPESALSPTRQLALLQRMHALVQKRSQFIIATHSPIILSYPNATIYELREGELKVTPYEETQLFKTAKEFFENHHRIRESLRLK